MMLHRHFEAEKSKSDNVTTLADVAPTPKIEDPIPETSAPEAAPKRRGGRSKKAEMTMKGVPT